MYIHLRYKHGWRPSRDPCTTLIVCTRVPETAAWFNLVGATLGVPVGAPTGRAPAVPAAPGVPAAYVSREDREATAEMDELEACLSAIFLVGDIDWGTRKVANLRLPVWSDTMAKLLRIKGADRRARLLKQAWMNLLNSDLGCEES